MQFWQFFRKIWNGCALLKQPSKMHHSIWKFLFVLGADNYLQRLEGKIRKFLFFYIKIFKNNSMLLYDPYDRSKLFFTFFFKFTFNILCSTADSKSNFWCASNCNDCKTFLLKSLYTGKSFSEALILESVNPQYYERLFIGFPEKYKFTTCCEQISFWMSKQKQTFFVHKMLGACIFRGIQWTISYHLWVKVKTLWEGHKIGKNLPLVLTKQLFLWTSQKSWTLTDERMKASEKDLPVITIWTF